jgi:hypothetical protein
MCQDLCSHLQQSNRVISLTLSFSLCFEILAGEASPTIGNTNERSDNRTNIAFAPSSLWWCLIGNPCSKSMATPVPFLPRYRFGTSHVCANELVNWARISVRFLTHSITLAYWFRQFASFNWNFWISLRFVIALGRYRCFTRFLIFLCIHLGLKARQVHLGQWLTRDANRCLALTLLEV